MNKYNMKPKVEYRNYRAERLLSSKRSKQRMIKSIILTTIILLFSFSFVFSLGTMQTKEKEGSKNKMEFVVRAGDSLWNIAEHYKPKNTDTRKYIYELMQLNGLTDTSIYVNQVLYLP